MNIIHCDYGDGMGSLCNVKVDLSESLLREGHLDYRKLASSSLWVQETHSALGRKQMRSSITQTECIALENSV